MCVLARLLLFCCKRRLHLQFSFALLKTIRNPHEIEFNLFKSIYTMWVVKPTYNGHWRDHQKGRTPVLVFLFTLFVYTE